MVLMKLCGQWLGEQVGQIVNGSYLLDLHHLALYPVTNVVVTYVNVLRTLVVDGYLAQIQ